MYPNLKALYMGTNMKILVKYFLTLIFFTFASNNAFSTDNLNGISSNVLIEDIVVTARKKEESAQDVPIALSAMSQDQLEIIKFRDFNDLAVGMPNVAMDEIGTTKGTQNFSIRGVGINSSIASVEPSVAIVLDGVYMANSAGMVFDMFDLESIQILRGPQGTLFGKNSTGGAVIVNTALPTDKILHKTRIAYEGGGPGGHNRIIQYSYSMPINSNLKGKISIHSSDDEGYFKNSYNKSNHGQYKQNTFRLAFVYEPNDKLEFILRYEDSDQDGTGPSAQCHINADGLGCQADDGAPVPAPNSTFSRYSLDFNIDNPGYLESKTKFFNTTTNWYLDNGVVTNVFGKRKYDLNVDLDVDARSVSFFDAPGESYFEQISNELRYNGSLSDNLDITAGLFMYESDVMVWDNRALRGVLYALAGSPGTFLWQSGGGLHNVKQTAIFSTFDYSINEKLSINLGVRLTDEEKEIHLASINRNVSVGATPPCSVPVGTCPYDYIDKDSWKTTSPKLGFTYFRKDTSMIYGYWTRVFKSGGYNLRNSVDLATFQEAAPKADDETVETFEIGMKNNFDRGRLNVAIFDTVIKDSQRMTNIQDPISGVAQVVKNAGDISYRGFEIDGIYTINDKTSLIASLGYVDSKYKNLISDLNGDFIINHLDYDLKIPRAAPLTFGIGINFDGTLGSWKSITRLNFYHRDKSYYNENNQGFINEQDIINFGYDIYSPTGDINISIYGKNLSNEVKHGGDTNLSFGGTFSPLAKGKITGLELVYKF